MPKQVQIDVRVPATTVNRLAALAKLAGVSTNSVLKVALAVAAIERSKPTARWQHWKNPHTGKWDGQAYKTGNVVGTTAGQGHNREVTCLNAIEAMSGSRESTRIEFKDRVRSPK